MLNLIELLVGLACIVEVTSTTSPLGIGSACTGAGNTSVLNLLILVPLPDETYQPAFDKGHSFVPAVQLAVKQINERKDILPEHCLEILVGDSGCDKETKTTVALLENLFYNNAEGIQIPRDNQVAGIIGPSCSAASTYLVRSLRRTGIAQLYFGTTPVLSNINDDYKYSFGMIGSSKVFLNALFRIAELRKWKWKNVAVLYESNREYFRDTYREFVKILNATGSTVGFVSPVIAPFFLPLKEIRRQNIRIVIALMSAQAARQLACLAGHLGFEYPIYQTVYTERILENFLDHTDFTFTLSGDKREYACNKQQIIKGLNGSVLLTYSLDTLDPSLMTESTYSIEQVRQQYRAMINEYAETINMTVKENSYAYPYYDAIWALALSINRTLNTVKASTLFNNSYVVTDASERLQSNIANISFQGVSVWVNFNKERHVTNNVDISQVDGEQLVKRGYWNGRNNMIVSSSDGFIDDEFSVEYTRIYTPLAGVGLTAIFITLVFIISVHIINTVKRESAAIKSNSPRLNHFIFIGSYLYIISVILITVQMGYPKILADTKNLGSIVCNMIPLTTILGSSLIISTIIAKLWRIYSIFRRTFDFQHFIGDKWLTAFILINTCLTMVLYIPVLVWSPFHDEIVHTKYVLNGNNTLPIKENTVSCYNLSVPWLITLPVVHQLCALTFAVMLAILNRKIKHKYFHSTVSINILVYVLATSVGMGGSILVILHLLNVNINAFYVVHIFILIFNICMCLLLLVVRFMFL